MAVGVAARLHRALVGAGIPVVGVSIGKPNDRATWRVDYTPAATTQHRIDGEAIRLAFDPLAPSEDTKDQQEVRDREIARTIIRAVAIAVHKRFRRVVPMDTTTAEEWRTAIRAEYDALL